MKIDRNKILNGLNKDDKILIASLIDKYEKYLKSGKEVTSNFLSSSEIDLFNNRLKKYNIDYHIIEKIEDSDKKIIGFGNEELLKNYITIYHGVSSNKIEHKDILGTLFSIGFTYNTIGDIYIDNNDFYLTNLTRLNKYLVENFTKVKNSTIKLNIIDSIKIEKKYLDLEISVNSLRIDSIISKLSNLSRNDSQDKIKNNDILINSKEINKSTTLIKEDDIISIRKVGKFKIGRIIGTTKKNKIILEVKKYM